MSKMRCRCGATISDVACPSPTEGWLRRDQDREPFQDAFRRDVDAFLQAVRDGRRDAWIAERLGLPHPENATDADVIEHLADFVHDSFLLSVAECFSCGRLWVQTAPDVNEYRSYAPDDPGYAAVLRATEPS